jgi:ABC-type dipeptide/oligopeptide/nickel transport system ATPase component
MRQRADDRMALACEPKLLIATSRRRRSTSRFQAQILDLLRRAVAEENACVILITHDLGGRRRMCDASSNVMYAGYVRGDRLR